MNQHTISSSKKNGIRRNLQAKSMQQKTKKKHTTLDALKMTHLKHKWTSNKTKHSMRLLFGLRCFETFSRFCVCVCVCY